MYTVNKKERFRPACGRIKTSKNALCMSLGSMRPLKISILFLTITILGQFALATTQISRHGITWTFDKDYQVGQFANGDYWVLDEGSGIIVMGISPGANVYNGFDVHGSEKNPVAGEWVGNEIVQGYDEQYGRYDASKNVGLNLPLTLYATDSLVSSISNTPPINSPSLPTSMKTAAVLTVMDSVPPEGTFRPSYTDRTHTTLYSTNQLNWSLLESLPTSGAPSISDVERSFERVWLDHWPGWTGVYYHPSDNMYNYGREIASTAGVGALMLHTNIPQVQKETLLIRYVQVGIDLYGILKNGGNHNWPGEAGHGQGRKLPIIFAGLMLDDAGMKGIGTDGGDYYFGMDTETFYVSQADVDLTNGPTWNPDIRGGTPYPYTVAMIGMPEWGLRYSIAPEQSDAAWHTLYRRCCTSRSWQGHILTALIMKSKNRWNHDALFDYMDRYTAITNGDPDPFGYPVPGETAGWQPSGWVAEMWDTYRPLLEEELDNTPPLAPTNLISTAQTENSISLAWDASSDPESGVNYYRIYSDSSQIDTSVSTSYSDTGLNSGTTYSYEVSAVNGQALESGRSNAVQATTLQDTTPPSILSVSSTETSLEITFSELLDSTSAEQTNNYSINNGISVIAASLDTDTVTLTTSAHTENLTYTLTVVDIQDLAGNSMGQTEIEYQYNQGLVGYWRFDEGSGTTTQDSSGAGNTGTLINGPVWTTGRIGNALSFDGIDDYVDIGNLDAVGTGITLTAWFKADSFIVSSADNRLISKATGSSEQDHYWMVSTISSGGTRLRFRLKTNGSTNTLIATSGDINTDEWVHAVAAYDGSSMILYKDGAEVGTLPKTGTISINSIVPAWIGRNPGGYAPFDGTIDEVHIYNRALAVSEILDLYNEGTTPDTNAPVISNVQTSNVTASQATITWNTDEASNSQVEYGLDTNYGSATNLDSSLVTSHSVLLTGLSQSTAYHFRVKSADTSGNESTSGDNTFTTSVASTYSIIAIAGSGGQINPSGTLVVSGGSQTYTITANAGYDISDVLVDGSSVGAVSSYSFTNVTTNHTIAASFATDTYTITASAGSGGTISPSGSTQVNSGSSQTYTITANAGYHVVDVLVDGSSVGAVSSYSFTNVTADHTIAASFAIDEQDVTAPTVTNLSPGADAIQASLNTLVTLDITDSGDGVDANTVEIKVNGDLIYDGDNETSAGVYNSTGKPQTVKGVCRRTGNISAYKYIYQPNEKFDFDQTLTVTVNANDLATTTNTMVEYSYSFISEMRSFGENKILSSGSSNDNWGPLTTITDSSGNIWVAWPQGVVGSRDIYVGKLVAGADSFISSGVVQVTDDIPDQGNPVIAVDSSDKLYLAWQDNRSGNWDIYVSISVDGGDNWSTEQKVVDSDANQVNPAIVVDNSNNAYIVWEDDRNGNKDIYIATSINAFLTKVVSQITTDSFDQFEPAIAADSSNTVYVVWTDKRIIPPATKSNNNIYGAASNDSWTNIPIVTKEESQSNPAIATEAVGSVLHLVWLDDTPGNDDIYYARTSDGLPGSPLAGSSIIDDTKGADQLSPVIITTGTGNDLKVFACWRDERNAEAELYAVEVTANGTNIYVGNDFTTDDQSQPAIGIDQYGYPYLVWINGRTDICYAGSTFIDPEPLVPSTLAPVSSNTNIGTPFGSINDTDDVSVEIPAGAYLSDITITISKIRNPQKPPSNNRTFLYEFGPSGTTFSEPVTITIPYNATTLVSSPSVYWYNPLMGLYSQEGITDVEIIQISSGLYALRFKTTHFSIFGGGGPFGGDGGFFGGGGCSMSLDSQASAVELLLPYVGLAVALGALNVRDRRRWKARKTKKSEC
ncbi:MAG: hypothetical protein FVQ85_19565 [Planctomycetes bacterium]|nr:hypothetical protein [Planctomycetota bacterium]